MSIKKQEDAGELDNNADGKKDAPPTERSKQNEGTPNGEGEAAGQRPPADS